MYYLRMVLMHLLIKFGADTLSNPELLTFFPHSSLDFQVMLIWLFRRVDSVVYARYQIWFKYLL